MNQTWPWPTLLSNQNKKAIAPGPVMVDIEGLQLSEHEKKRLQHPLVGAVILFSRNYESPQQLTQLCQSIHDLRDEPLLIAVDHEGGRVQRFKSNGFTHLPDMATLGKLWQQRPSLANRLASEVGYILAAELRACGVDFSFTPVLDLDYGQSQVIGNRSFDRDPQIVAGVSRSLIQGLALAGMAACGKHFPGHGFVQADSHVALPVDERSFEDIMKDDIVPYLALGDMVLPSIMPAHVIYRQCDAQPAGFSKFWIQDVLRDRLNYQGMVFSDDLTMEGATVAGDITQRAQAAFSAGCDMVLVCNRPDLADELLQHLQHQMPAESVNRLRALYPQQAFMSWSQLQQDSRYLYARELRSKYLPA
ncbi:beta-N-acetylhexosaminidase [Brackiella oedipodis]|uniref:beta-N-acetylhexosaminidase n=1 Tax=Brackiella oedipodis TaxID=124225 RepID=UPI0005711E81|nr:beta-N-acetylhexosaminidase [Brackiella oedipodis]